MNQYILLFVAIVGVILIFKKDIFLQYIPRNINDQIRVVYENNTIIGSVIIVVAYYLYTKEKILVVPRLPSYSESTSELVSSQ